MKIIEKDGKVYVVEDDFVDLEEKEEEKVREKTEKKKEEKKVKGEKKISRKKKKEEKKKIEKKKEVKKETLKGEESKKEVKLREEIKEEEEEEKVIVEKYSFNSDGIPVTIEIYKSNKEFVPIYRVIRPSLDEANKALLNKISEKILENFPEISKRFDYSEFLKFKEKFKKIAKETIKKFVPKSNNSLIELFNGMLLHNMLGLGDIEILMQDDNIEEVVVNNSKEPIWVYSKKHGWLKTNLFIESEGKIENYASAIGRKVGRQINILNPLMDAYLLSGDRVNATLFPISSKGNTITIRKFRRKPFTVTELIMNKTVSKEVVAFLWLAIQYELSVIVAGGTASGKTTFLNVLASLIPPNHRIISIEDTRELNLPKFLHWVPLTTREPNPEGKGEVSMLQLLVNSLRMRPDRIIVGEIRRQREAEVLFEALHTGHSVYATLHADTSEQAISRITNPPINIPPSMVTAVDLFAVMFRDRRKGVRRLFEVAEVLPTSVEGRIFARANLLYQWNAREDKIEKIQEGTKVIEELQLKTGMTREEIKKDLKEKEEVLDWLVKNKITDLNEVGKIISLYYSRKDYLLKKVRKSERQ